MKYEEITKRIIGCAMRVDSNLVNGFQEVILSACNDIELNLDKLNFKREKGNENLLQRSKHCDKKSRFFC